MISAAIRTRVLVSVLAALTLVTGSLLLIFYEPRLESLPETHEPANDGPKPTVKTAPDNETRLKPWSSAPSRVTCVGPRGLDLGQEPNDDNLHESVIENLAYPHPFVGSYETLNLSKTWMTAADRYGPYGWHDDRPEYGKTKVEWGTIDWSSLQNHCLQRNALRFQQPTPIRPGERRFRMREADEEINVPILEPQGAQYNPRTAIVFRAREGYNYTLEDLVNLRATIAETSLRFSSDYTVFLLVDVKDTSRNIFSTAADYQRAILDLVPPEFQGITILFDETLLASWYPTIKSHSTTYQIMQPLQLFGHFYPEFAHVWQLELDARFTGHAGRYLTALTTFARAQPRKQAAERSTWYYMPSIHGPYSALLSAINTTLSGGGGIAWPSLALPATPGFSPLGPFGGPDPLDDDFTWGVGDEADFIAFAPCAHIPLVRDWYWRDWHQGFSRKRAPGGWMCQPAMGRASRVLLQAVHHAQARLGLAIHSEATLPSFALWHGMKLVAPPGPMFQDPRWDEREMDEVYNGGARRRPEGMLGMAYGKAVERGSPWEYVTQKASFWWKSRFADRIYDAWLGRKGEVEEVPYVLWKGEDGRVWAPNMVLHPVKTNQNLPEGLGVLAWVGIGVGVVTGVLGALGAGLSWMRRRRHGQYALLKRDDTLHALDALDRLHDGLDKI